MIISNLPPVKVGDMVVPHLFGLPVKGVPAKRVIDVLYAAKGPFRGLWLYWLEGQEEHPGFWSSACQIVSEGETE